VEKIAALREIKTALNVDNLVVCNVD